MSLMIATRDCFGIVCIGVCPIRIFYWFEATRLTNDANSLELEKMLMPANTITYS